MNEHKYNIIVLSGKIGTGKDTVGNYINMKYGFKKYAFADKLKEVINYAVADNSRRDERSRKLLQSVGKDFRNYDEDFWVRHLCWKVISESVINDETETNVVITDARHINEIENISKYIYPINKFITIRILSNNNSDRYTDEEINNDISETGLDNYEHFKYYINNNTTIENMYNQVDMIMKYENFQRIIIPEMC